MDQLQFGKRANHRNFPRRADEWDLDLVFMLEKDAIDNHLCKQAGTNWRLSKGLNFRDRENVFSYAIKNAMEQWDALHSNIAAAYAQTGAGPANRIIDNALRGNPRLEAPTKGKIRTMTALLVLSVIAESTVMLIQQAFTGDFNPFIFVIAFMLALGGVLQGLGVGNLLVKHWKEDTERPESERPLIYWIEIGVGTLLILLVAAMRGSSAFDPSRMFLVFGLTLLLGEAVALFEAQREKYKAMRTTLLNEMLQAQQWRANKLHDQLLAENRYRATYEAALQRAAQIDT